MLLLKSTNRVEQLYGMVVSRPERPVMITEGDSWFGYPAGVIPVSHTGTNIIDHIEDANKFNILRLETSGDEASAMMAQNQRHQLDYVLESLAKKAARRNNPNYLPKYILFSAGGNDIVGEHDIKHFLNEYRDGMTARRCFRSDRFQVRLQQIKAAYKELISFRNDYCPDAYILTHCYDYLVPTGKGARFLGALKVGPWIKPYMVKKKKIEKPQLQKDIVKLMIKAFSGMLDEVAAESDRFIKVNTLESIQDNQWVNEIHPNRAGFGEVARRFLEAIDGI